MRELIKGVTKIRSIGGAGNGSANIYGKGILTYVGISPDQQHTWVDTKGNVHYWGTGYGLGHYWEFVDEESQEVQSLTKLKEDVKVMHETTWSGEHYDKYYHLTPEDIAEGKIRLDAYTVAKVWKIGSKDDSGALFHTFKLFPRWGEKNTVEREIVALYNQAKALARVYNVKLENK